MLATLPDHDLARIADHAAQADRDGWLHPEQQVLIHERGWLKMLAPRSAGGAELALPDVVRLE
ncbi:MAG: acyl-CoA dehydrogenase, partial [Telluria sp.]